MTVATSPLSNRVEIANGDVRTTYRNRTWQQFKFVQAGFEDSPAVRLFYYDGTIEILMPGRAHEIFKGLIGFLLEYYLHTRRVNFASTGSMTQEKEGLASAEPDESFEIDGLKLTIEVNFTSGNISKLKRYRVFGVDEVWIWQDGVLDAYHLRGDGYEKVEQSLIPSLSTLDLTLMSECILMGETNRIQALDKLVEGISGD